MRHSLRDFKASCDVHGWTVVVTIGTSNLQAGTWNTVPIFTPNEWRQVPGYWVLLCCKDDLSLAHELWPEATVQTPDNTNLVTVQ